MKNTVIALVIGITLVCSAAIISRKDKYFHEYQNATLTSGPYHAMVIKENGELISWGDSYWSVLGTDEGYERFPTKDSKVMENARWIAASQFASYAVDVNGTCWSWGNMVLGRDGIMEKPMPVMEDVKMVSAGTFHALALKKDGSLWGWGEYTVGQLGRGMGNERITKPEIHYVEKHENMPVKIMDDIKYVSAGGNSSYVIKNDDTLWSFGGNNLGQLGDGTTENQTEPIKIMENVRHVDGGGNFAIRYDDSLWNWGFTDEMDLHHGSLQPEKIMDDVKYATRGHGEQRLVVKNDGSLWTWGKNHLGILGDGTLDDRWEPRMIIDSGVVRVTGSSFLTLALKEDGSLWHMGCYSDFGGESIKLPHKFMDDVKLP